MTDDVPSPQRAFFRALAISMVVSFSVSLFLLITLMSMIYWFPKVVVERSPWFRLAWATSHASGEYHHELMDRWQDEGTAASFRTVQHSELNDRCHAAGCLAYSTHPDAAGNLIRLLADGEPTVRAWAAYSLGIRKETLAIPALIARISDSNEAVRTNVIEALGHIGGPEALAAVTGAMADASPDVANFAKEAIHLTHRWIISHSLK